MPSQSYSDVLKESYILSLIIPKLPLLVHCLGISVAIYLSRFNSISKFDLRLVIFTAFTIFSTLNILTKFSPKTVPAVKQGAGYGIGYNMIGGGEKAEKANKTEDCNCKNPYDTKSIHKLTMEQLDKLPKHVKLMVGKQYLSPQAQREIDPDLPTGISTDIIKDPKKVKVKTVASKLTLCKSLEKHGYNPNWTLQTVSQMSKLDSGLKHLQDINKAVCKELNIKRITVGDLAQCYPHFYQSNSYTCTKKTPEAPEIKGINPGIQPEPKKDINIAKNCHWSSITKELHRSIKEHYSSSTGATGSTLATIQYLRNRTELEFRNLINIFQTKPKREFRKYFSEASEQEPKGYHIKGTTYYIPWSLINKYSVCFGY